MNTLAPLISALLPRRSAIVAVVALAALSMPIAPSAAAPAPAVIDVGQVTFAIGDVRVAGAATAGRLQRGAAVHPGQTIETGESGHLHIRFTDGAAIAVRPQSRLLIEHYDYDPARPADSRIRFRLEEGAMRSITGRGGEAAKDRFRLNTPVAAIGIKGTDFNVQTSGALTRASVFEGGIVVSPLGAACDSGAFGPCRGPAARELSGADKDFYALEVHGDQMRVTLAARRADMPRPGTPAAMQTAAAEAQDALNDVRAVITLANNAAVPAAAAPPDVPSAPPPDAALWWGRWAAFADPADPAGTYVAKATAGRELAGGNQLFGLLRENTVVANFPTRGAATFSLMQAEAYTVMGTTLTPARTLGGSLGLDFDAQRFTTQLSVVPAGMGQMDLTAQGRIEGGGRFYATPAQSSMWVSGALAPGGQQAGYAFERPLQGGGFLSGATLWIR